MGKARLRIIQGEIYMKITKGILWLGSIVMVGGLINVLLNGDLAVDGPKIISNPWGLISLIDLYLGLILFSIWMIYREKNIIVIIILLALLMIFGFLAASIYVLVNLKTSKGDWGKFFLGQRKERFTNTIS